MAIDKLVSAETTILSILLLTALLSVFNSTPAFASPAKRQPELTQVGGGVYKAGPEVKSEQEVPELNTSIVFMLCFTLMLTLFFLWEPMPLYFLTLTIPVLLVVFQPWTGITGSEAISGFASDATITLLGMFVISEGIKQTGLIQILGDKLSDFAGSNTHRQLTSIVGLSGPIAGIINNTPVVAIFIPVVSNLARRVGTSPSLLMIPLSYAAMMGGTLTLIGSSTNLLASELSAQLLDRSIGFFEFSGVGLITLATGGGFLIIFGRYLVPERIRPEQDRAEEFEMEMYLTELIIREESDLIGINVRQALNRLDMELDLVRIIRGEKTFMEPLQVKTLRPNDRLIVRAGLSNLLELLDQEGIEIWSRARVSEAQLEVPAKGQLVVETVVPSGSFLEDQTLDSINFVERYDATVLAIRRGEELTHTKMEELTIRAGDVFLLLTTEKTLRRLRQNSNFIVAEEIEENEFKRSKMPVALFILGGVIFAAGSGLLPIPVAALAGVIAMVLAGCVTPDEIHDSVDWEVIFLLAGLIPLGNALGDTGTARYISHQVLRVAKFLPDFGTLLFFYLFTAVMTNLIHKNAAVVLIIPIAVDAASSLGLNPFPFLLTVMFASSTAFLTPVGNQTNMMVYGPGGYRFVDFIRAGLPLQLLLAVVTPLAVTLFWPL